MGAGTFPVAFKREDVHHVLTRLALAGDEIAAYGVGHFYEIGVWLSRERGRPA